MKFGIYHSTSAKALNDLPQSDEEDLVSKHLVWKANNRFQVLGHTILSREENNTQNKRKDEDILISRRDKSIKYSMGIPPLSS